MASPRRAPRPSHPGVLLLAALLAAPRGGVAVAATVADALPAIRAVDHEGKGNARAAEAWAVLAAADASALP